MMRFLCVLLPSGFLAAAARPASAQTPETEKKITLQLKDVPLRDALAILFAGTKYQYAVEANVPDVAITLNIRDVTFQQALRLIIRMGAAQVPGLTASRE